MMGRRAGGCGSTQPSFSTVVGGLRSMRFSPLGGEKNVAFVNGGVTLGA